MTKTTTHERAEHSRATDWAVMPGGFRAMVRARIRDSHRTGRLDGVTATSLPRDTSHGHIAIY